MLRGSLFEEERGVTPVIGIILVVAITVVLAAVIGQYVFGLDIIQSQDPGPQVAFDTDYDGNNNELTIRHQSGDKIENAQSTLSIVVSDNGGMTASETIPSGDMVTSDEITVSNVASDATVRVIWTNPDTGDALVLFKWKGGE